MRGRLFSDHLLVSLANKIKDHHLSNIFVLLNENKKNNDVIDNFYVKKKIKAFSYSPIFLCKNLFFFFKSLILLIRNVILIRKKGFEWFKFNFKVNDTKIGDLFIDHYNRFNLRFQKKIINFFTLNTLFKTIFKTIQIENIIDKKKIDLIVTHHSGYANNGSISTKIGLKKNLIVLEPKYLNYVLWDNYKLKNGFGSLKVDKYFKDHRKRYKYRINQNEINNFVKKRISNKVSTNYTWSVDLKNSNKLAIKKAKKFEIFLKKDKKIKRIVLIAPHAFSDAAHVDGSDFLFMDYYEHLRETLEFIKNENINDILWVVRPHPSGHRYGENGIVEKLLNKIKFQNLVLCPKNISTNEILKVCSVVITGRGTIGIEAACYGKFCINAGPSIYSGYNFSLDPKNKKEYFSCIKKVKTIKPLNKKQINTAKSILYYLEKDSPTWQDQIMFNKFYSIKRAKLKNFLTNKNKKSISENLSRKLINDKIINPQT